MHVSIAQANLPKMYLDYSPISMLFFLSTCGLCSRSLYTSLWGGEKMYFFSTQSNKKSVNLGTLPVFNFYHQTPCDLFSYLFVWKHERIYMEEIWKSEEFVWKCEGFLKKNEKLYGKMLNSTEKVK